MREAQRFLELRLRLSQILYALEVRNFSNDGVARALAGGNQL